MNNWVINIVGCLICLLLSTVLLFSAQDERIRTAQALSRLRRPNQFIGLQTVPQWNKADFPARVIHPHLLSIINQSAPSQSYGDDPQVFKSWRKFWPPDERTFHVSATISTIAEFRAVDYSMEDCELRITLPRTVKEGLTLGESPNLIDIWTLRSTHPIDAKSLTWRSRPPRTSKLATIDVGLGTIYRYRFPCPIDSLWAFEFSASAARGEVGADAEIKWYQNFSGPAPRLDVIERSILKQFTG